MPQSGHKPYITTTKGGAGWFAVQLWWNPEGFTEPYQTGFGRYPDKAGAEREAKYWAEAEELEYIAEEAE